MITSPTFTLVQMYDGETKNHPVLTVWHFDLYRLKSADEIYELGFEEALSGGGREALNFAGVPVFAGCFLLFALRWRINVLTLGEYIGKIYMETKARPRYIISERTWAPYERKYHG